MLESLIERQFVDYCRSHGAICLKNNANWYANFPDRTVYFVDNSYFFIELKRPGEKIRPGQRKRFKQLQLKGFPVYWADTLDAAIRIFDARAL